MVFKSAVQVLQQAEDLKIKSLANYDLLNDSTAWTDQQKLQSIYHKVLVLDLEYALDKKVEQDLWNIGFKNHITHLQDLIRDKKSPRRSDCQALLNWCLEAASGFYISLLQELCNTLDIDLPFRRQGRIYGQIKDICSDQLNAPQSSSCLYICQYCLVHLGDIARYRNQRQEAESFYKQAIQVSPTSGHPYNQLALLEASLGDKLSTVFYYIRGIAVKNPFPAATTNLLSTFSSLMDKESHLEKVQTKMTANEFIHLFLCSHGYLYTANELDQAKLVAKSLNTTMTALVATESFTAEKLVKLTVINLYALKHVMDTSTTIEDLSADEIRVRDLILDLLGGSLSAFLVPVHTLKSDETLLDYYALPAVKIIFQWIQNEPNVLTEVVFTNRLQIWPSFCKLLNNVQQFLDGFDYEKYAKLPLSEDRNLEGFSPLSKYLKQLDYNVEERNEKIHKLVRVKRLLQLAIWVSEYDVNGTKLITKKENGDYFTFEPGCIQPDPTNDLLEEIKSFSIETKSDVGSKKTSEKKAGILKPQGSLEKSREERELLSSNDPSVTSDSSFSSNSSLNNKHEAAKMKRAKQNVALQSIFKKMEENKQVKFSVEEKAKDKAVKFDQKLVPKAIGQTPTQFGSAIRSQPYNQNHQAFPKAPNQDYLTTLRNMANAPNNVANFSFGKNEMMQFTPQMFDQGPAANAGQSAWPAGANYNSLPVQPNTYNNLANSTGFDANQAQSWWQNQNTNPGAAGAFPAIGNNPYTPVSVPPKAPANQASGDSFNSPWNNYGGNYTNYPQNAGGMNYDGGNMNMRQAMLKEANVPVNMNDKFMQNQQNTTAPGYSLFNTNSWNPNLSGQLRTPKGPSENPFGHMQQSSLFANQGPQSLAQLLEQQNQMQKNDFH